MNFYYMFIIQGICMDSKINITNEELIAFLKEKFPSKANDIKESLELLENVIQNTIDVIEEKSSDLVKKERNFYESHQYRLKENELFSISMELTDMISKLDVDNENVEEADIDKIEADTSEKSIPNYNEYLVDDRIQHTLYEDFTYKRPAAFELMGQKYMVKDWKDMLLEACNILASNNKDIIMKFPSEPKMNGKKVTYFAFKESEILRAPRKLRDYDIYISTNHSANSIRNILSNVLRAYRIQPHDFKIYLRADYSDLHE